LPFLEQQALQKDLRQLLKDRKQLDFGEDHCAGMDADLDNSDVNDEWPSPPQSHRLDRWFTKPWVRWSTVLAVGVLAFVGGLALQSFDSNLGTFDGGFPRSQGVAGDIRAPIDALASHQATTEMADSVVIDGAFGGNGSSFEVPIRLISNVGDEGQIPKFAPERLPSQIAGFLGDAVDANGVERLVYIIRTRDGRMYLLPVDRITQGIDYQ
jgi:hypothetical protein